MNEVNGGISRLECNKACGLDGVSAEHLKHCSSRVTPLLAMCITGFMVHGFLVQEFYAQKGPFTKLIATEGFSTVSGQLISHL